LSGRLITLIDPRALLPACRILQPKAVPIMERFSFSTTPPRLDISFEADTGESFALRMQGRMQASQYAYSGAGIGFANITAEYEYGNGTNRLKLDPFLVVVSGRSAEGKTVFDLDAGTIGFEVSSSVDLATLLRLSGMREQRMESWTLDEGARVVAKGKINTRVPEDSRIEATVEGARIGFGSIEVNDYAFRFDSAGLTNAFTEVRGKIGNGSFSGSLVAAPDASGSNLHSRVRIDLIHVDADRVLEVLTPDTAWRAGGKLYGHADLAWAGGAADPRGLSGKGQMAIRNSQIFRLPLMTGVKAELNRRIPEIDLPGSPVDAHFSYELKDGRIVTSDLRADGALFGMTAAGSVGLDRTLECLVTVQWMKRKGFLPDSLSGRLFSGRGMEFNLSGTLAAPKWTPADRR
jgi:hypothetical protein